jgi:translation initiation factor 2-alpha kinase 4
MAEQKRIDSSTSGTIGYPSAIPASSGSKDTSGGGDVQLLLPVDTKKQRKQVKQILLDKGTRVICTHRIRFV